MLSVRRLGLRDATGLQDVDFCVDVDFCCVGGPDVSQPFHDSAARHLLPFLVREGHADRRADGAIGCAGGAGLGFGGRERRVEGRERRTDCPSATLRPALAPKRQKAPAGAFWRSSLMHFYSGTPMHFYSGVDISAAHDFELQKMGC